MIFDIEPKKIITEIASGELKLAREFIAESIKGTEFAGNTYIAGGAVRDKMLNRPVKDIDILVTIKDGGIKLAEFLGNIIGKDPVIYQSYGTAQLNFGGFEYRGTVFSKQVEIEFVHSRKEAYRGTSRNPETEYGTIHDDSRRRDFTINSMFEDIITGEILDLTKKGKSDMKNRVLRSSGDPDIIFKEDPLRILRAVRFATKYGFKIEQDTFEGMKKYSPMLKHIVVERISDELRKILSSGIAGEAFHICNETGITKEIYRITANANPSLVLDDAYYHIMNSTTNLYINLYMFFAPVFFELNSTSKNIETILGKLRFTNTEISEVVKLWWALKQAEDDASIANILYVIDTIEPSDTVREFINIDAYNMHGKEVFQTAYEMYKPFPLNGSEIMQALGLKSGKIVGKAIQIGKEHFFNSLCTASKDDIVQYIKKELSEDIA